MKLRPIELGDIPKEMTGTHKDSLPQRIYEATVITVLDGKSQACEVREDRVSKRVLCHALQETIKKCRFPCEAVMRNGDVYLIKTI